VDQASAAPNRYVSVADRNMHTQDAGNGQKWKEFSKIKIGSRGRWQVAQRKNRLDSGIPEVLLQDVQHVWEILLLGTCFPGSLFHPVVGTVMGM
jgi:hypothetical protein